MHAPSSPPKLNARVPIRHGAIAIAAAVSIGAGLFAVDVDQGPVAAAAAVRRAEPIVVRHDTGGTLVHIHVGPGVDVVAGALIAQLDRRHVENELAALRKRIDAKRMEIDGLRQEVSALSGAGDKTTMRGRIATLEGEATDADRVIVGHSTRIALLEGQLDRMEIRAPVAGRVVEIPQAAVGSQIAAKAPIAIIRPHANRLQIDVAWPVSAAAQPSVGQTARLWPAGHLGLGGSYSGTIESVGSDALDAPSSTQAGPRARVVLDVTGTALAEQRDGGPAFNVQLVTGSMSLAQHLFAPLFPRRTVVSSSHEGARP